MDCDKHLNRNESGISRLVTVLIVVVIIIVIVVAGLLATGHLRVRIGPKTTTTSQQSMYHEAKQLGNAVLYGYGFTEEFAILTLGLIAEAATL